MAYKKSGEKRQRQNIKRNERNRIVKKRVRTAIKNFMASLARHEKEVAAEKYMLVEKLLDKAAGKGVMHRNTSARRKSSLRRLLNSLG